MTGRRLLGVGDDRGSFVRIGVIAAGILILGLAAFSVVENQKSAEYATVEMQEFHKELEAAKQRVAELEKEKAEVEQTRAGLLADAEAAKQRAKELEKEKEELLNEKHQSEGEIELVTQRAAEVQKQMDELEKEKARLKGEAGSAGTGVGVGAAAAPDSKIPKILHFMYLGEDGPPEKHKLWMETCKLQYSERAGWKYMYWTMDDVISLVKKHRPEYMATWDKFPKHVMKIDAGKYFIMQYVGGLYLDTDTECFREGYDMLEGYDLVVQQDYAGAAVNSGVMAAKPNHPVWGKAFEIMEERKDHDPNDTGHSTGPQIVRDMIARFHDHKIEGGFFPDRLTGPDGSITRVYPQGTWFTPCGFSSGDCMRDFMLKRAAGSVNLTELVGFHRFTALWLGWKDGVHPQSEETILGAFCKDYNATKAP